MSVVHFLLVDFVGGCCIKTRSSLKSSDVGISDLSTRVTVRILVRSRDLNSNNNVKTRQTGDLFKSADLIH